SKKISEKKRDELYDIIIENAVSYAIELVDNTVIDEINILNAAQLAMRKSIERLTPNADLALVDGNVARNFPCDAVTVVKGDAKSLLIAAASILAKTARDEDCLRMEALYPGYGFAKHKGYPTKMHFEALAKLGPCPEHRRSFGPVSQMTLPLG
ncbi:MAG: ribonuclease HII, partial [Kiritimatiellae bacterium]|nr:ribonuclease HII [Kiritimatiellia bacterium]